MAEVPKSAHQTCYLLRRLPAELRNSIYRLVIRQKDEDIKVNSNGYPRPAILNTCHQARNETLAMFYDEHIFHLSSRDYDATIAFQFFMRLHSGLHRTPRVLRSCRERQQPNWTNLLQALEWTHQGVCGVSFEHPAAFVKEKMHRTQLDQVVVSGMFMTGKKLRSVPWEEVKQIFVGQRAVLEVLHPRWAVDNGNAS
ncbi:hypothetical protein Tdes44962_MAKER06261 [Teratosphaeria destructans]|uniref:Uncharacterized protein n=1 Tax=Teratosphaeria destructans TaxID=418781 RepID=A0A9W7SIE4_9PEZI|nr:hypothetical protein Tdes44962_MAKER06261 [Teratosphaeria destructans]